MDDRIYLIDLYDLYKDLLTEKECISFEDYYFDDLSLSEIADELKITRAGVAKFLKTTKDKLYNYESILKKGELLKYVNSLKDEKLKKELERFL